MIDNEGRIKEIRRSCMKNKGKMAWIVFLLILIFVGGYFAIKLMTKESDQPSISKTTTEDPSVVASIEAEKVRVSSEKESSLKASEEEAEKRAQAIRAQTIYLSVGGKIYEDSSVESEVKEVSDNIRSLFAEKTLKDADGKDAFYLVKDHYDAEEPLGYVTAASTRKQRSDFIAITYEGVDYERFEKNESFSDHPKKNVKAVYCTAGSAYGNRIDELIEMIDRTQLNALVIDVKDDSGNLLFKSAAADQYNPVANEHYHFDDIKPLIKKIKEKDIYLIARIVTFKSPRYAKTHLENAIVYRSSGKPYSDGDGIYWSSPYIRDLWEYNVAIAKEAAEVGFDEIQFDYVRFPAIFDTKSIDYKNANEETPTAAIQKFLKYAYSELSPLGVYVAADVFGWTATALDDVGIGQHWEALSNVVDYTCPMVYPSHYSKGNFGLANPNANPYETVRGATIDSIKRNQNIETPAMIRPWIQDFSYAGITYGPKQLDLQIKALEELGIHEYMLWNPSNIYNDAASKLKK